MEKESHREEKRTDEALLLKGLQSGSPALLERAFECFYERHKRLCFFIVGRHLSNEEDVKEVVNEAFASFFHALLERDKPREILRNSKAYLLKIATNKAYDRLREEQKADDPDGLLEQAPAKPSPSYLRIETDLLSFLSVEETSIVLLSLQGYTAKEIGKMMQKSRSNVSVIYSRALKKLRIHKEVFR